MTTKLKIPKIRFKEFSWEWEEKRLWDLLSIWSWRDYKHLHQWEYPVYWTWWYMLSVSDYLYDWESVCIWRKWTIDKPRFLTGKFWTVDTLFYTHSFIESFPKYVFYLFNNINWQEYNEASWVPSLSKSTLNNIKLNLPSLPEQQKIASFLSSVDEKIEKIKEKKKNLEEYKKWVMQKIFSQEIRFKDENWEEFGEWEEKKLGEIWDFQTSSIDKISRDWEKEVYLVNYMNVYRHESINNLNKDKLHIVTAKDSQILSNNLKKWDILFTPSSETPDDIWHSVVIFEDLENCVYSYHLMRFRPKIQLNILYSHYFCNIPEVLNQLAKLSTWSTRFTISVKSFSSIEVKLPTLQEQEKIADFLFRIDGKIEKVSDELEKVEEFKKGLLQGMFV